jgi:amino acid adenylation domain-containing protein
MKVSDIVQTLDALDIDLGVVGDNLILTGNTDALPQQLKTALTETKAELIKGLKGYRRTSEDSRTGDLGCYFYLASHGQQRLAFLDALHPQSSAYIVAASVFFRGQVDQAHLVECLRQVAFEQDAVFTYLLRSEECDLAVVDRSMEIELPVIDLSGHAKPDEEILRLRDAISTSPFDLTTPPLWRAVLVKMPDNGFELIVAIHHFISDGWSLAAAFRRLAQIYGHKPVPVAARRPRAKYQHFARQQRQRMLQPDVPQMLLDAQAALSGCSLASQRFDGRLRVPVTSDRAGRAAFSLDPLQAGQLRALAGRHSLTIGSLLAGAFALTLHRFIDADRFAIGIAASNRPEVRFEDCFGFFVNWLAVPVDCRGDQNFISFVEQFHAQKLGAIDRIFLPFEEIVKLCGVERQPHLHPLFQYMFVSHVPARRITLSGMDISLLPLPNGSAKLDLTMFLTDSHKALAVDGEGDLFLELEYNAELFSQSTIDRFVALYREFLASVTVKADMSIAEMIGQSPSIVHGKQQHCPNTMLTLFDQAAQQYAGEIALECDGESWTYDQLHRRAAQIAEQLQIDGASGKTVCILSKRGFDQIAATIGALAARAAFTTLDINAPVSRNRRIFADACPKVLLFSDSVDAGQFELQADQIVANVGLYGSERDAGGASLADPAIRPDDPAYNFYTSGSTGTPKGVTISHQAFANFAAWMGNALALTGADHVLAKTPVSFDAFLRETLASLCFGCRIVMANDQDSLDIEKLVSMISDQNITVLHATPTIYAAMLADAGQRSGTPLQSLSRVMCGGEEFSPGLAALHFELSASCRIFNVYGPTECTVDVTCKEITHQDCTTITLGHPIHNCSIIIVDEAMRPVDQGQIGEIIIAGTPVGLGYRQGGEAFFDGDFLHRPARAYRTGDCGRLLPSGEIQYCGRTDRQIKVRGMRIEPAEIEAVIETHPRVRKAVVLPLPANGNDVRLFAAVEPLLGSGVVDEDLAMQLHDHASRSLPPAMTPALFLPVAAFPRTAHGKLDQSGLLEMAGRCMAALGKPVETTAANPIEAEVIAMAAELLGHANIGPNDNFFAIGGHSLSAVRLLSKVNKRFGTALTVKDLFAEPTVAAVAAAISLAPARGSKSEIIPLRRSRRTVS